MAIEQIIFDFLQVPQSALSGVIVNDLINYVLLPSVILIVFLDAAATMFVGALGKFKHLVAITLYLVIITQGFYGPFAQFSQGYVVIFIIFAAGAFFVSRFFGRRGVTGTEGISTKMGEKLDERNKKKKVLKELEKQRNSLRAQLGRVQSQYNHERDPQLRATYSVEIGNLRNEINYVERQMATLRR